MGGCRSNNSCSCDFSNLLNIMILVITFLVYLVNQNILKETNCIFFLCYFNDLLAPILLLSFSNFLLYYYNKEIKGKNIYLFIGICALFWEFITPLYKKNSICDFIDILMYFIGASIYVILVRGCRKWKNIRKKLS